MMSDDAEKNDKPETVRLDYVKSTAHRVVFVNGAHGGLNPDGLHVHMSLFNERSAIPRTDVHELKVDGGLGERIERLVRSDVVREVEVTLVFDMNGAKMLRDWATRAVEMLETAEKQRQQQTKGQK